MITGADQRPGFGKEQEAKAKAQSAALLIPSRIRIFHVRIEDGD